MRKLLFTTMMLVPLAAYAAVINGTEGNDNLQGTPDDDTINAFGGDDVVEPQFGNDISDLGDGEDFFFDNHGDGVITGGDGDKTVSIAGGNQSVTMGNGDNVIVAYEFFGVVPFMEVLAGDGANFIGCPNSICNVTAGDGGNKVHGGVLIQENPNASATIITGSGADMIFDGGGMDYMEGGAGNDRIDSFQNADIMLGGPGNDAMVFGLGDSVAFGEEGRDNFEFRTQILTSGDKEVGDLNGMKGGLIEDTLDFTFLPLSKEDIINSMTIIENGGGGQSFSQMLKTQDRQAAAIEYQEARVKRIGKHKTVWRSKTFQPLGLPVNKRGVDAIWAELEKQCKRRMGDKSFSLITSAYAAPEAGDILIEGMNASVLIKDGVEKIANGDLTPDNILAQF